MKKIIFTFILIITFSSNAFSDHFYKNWGVVVDIKPIYYNQVINKIYAVVMNQSQHEITFMIKFITL